MENPWRIIYIFIIMTVRPWVAMVTSLCWNRSILDVLHSAPPLLPFHSKHTHTHMLSLLVLYHHYLEQYIICHKDRPTVFIGQLTEAATLECFWQNGNMDNIYCAGKRNSKGASSVSLLSIYWTLNSISGLQDFWMNVIKWIPICGAFHSRPAVESASIFHLSARLSATLEPFFKTLIYLEAHRKWNGDICFLFLLSIIFRL